MNKAVTFAKADGKRNYPSESWIAFFKPNVKQIPGVPAIKTRPHPF
jgi:hypothetical protein